MAADKTFGVKVTDEVMERVNAMIGASGESSKKNGSRRLLPSWKCSPSNKGQPTTAKI